MIGYKTLLLLVAVVCLASAVPVPGFHSKHEHHTIHVPYKIHTHTIHHHHVQKIPIYKHIVKEVPIIKEVVKEVPVVKEVIKEVPVVKEVHVPIIKEVHVPIHVQHESYGSSHHDFSSHGW